MGTLCVLSRRGDDRVTWDERLVEMGDPEALAAIREAECIFEEQRAKGAMAVKVETDGTPTRIEHFDQAAERIVMEPRVLGG